MAKFGCNSKDSIARISEKSKEYQLLVKHYHNIYKRKLFDKLVQKIRLLNKTKGILVTHNLPETDMAQKLIDLLKKCEIHAERKKSREDTVYISVNSATLLPSEQDNEISLFFSILRCFCNDSDTLILINKLESKEENISINIDDRYIGNSKQPFAKIMITFFIIIVASFCCIKVYFYKKDEIMSNLYYISNNIVARTSLLLQIDKAINENKNDIKVVVLTGQGSAGKTTLARNFIKDKSVNIKWEINAESTHTIIDSFYDLATTLANKYKKQEELSNIKSIPDSEERTKQIMLFVQSHIKRLENWYLLFDNVDEINLIKKYFPANSEIWGKGTILITTRNKNIGKCDLFHAIVIDVGYLSEDEQYLLFCNILYDDIKNISLEKSAEIKLFLSKIPMFPLDVSSAAYYIKNTNIEFDNYLSCEAFENIHKKVISEYMGYNKTRNGIIASMFSKIIQENPDFKGLLLLICLIDSQNIHERSNVMAAIDPEDKLPSCTIRISFSDQIKAAQLVDFAKKLKLAIEQLRREKNVGKGCESISDGAQKDLNNSLDKIKELMEKREE